MRLAQTAIAWLARWTRGAAAQVSPEPAIPPGTAQLWLRIRDGEDVFGRLLETLQGASMASLGRLRPVAWDLARASAHAARTSSSRIVAAFAARRRTAELGVVERRVSEAIYRVVMDDLAGARELTDASLSGRARETFEALARAELARR
jgi:hypothetical protein